MYLIAFWAEILISIGLYRLYRIRTPYIAKECIFELFQPVPSSLFAVPELFGCDIEWLEQGSQLPWRDRFAVLPFWPGPALPAPSQNAGR